MKLRKSQSLRLIILFAFLCGCASKQSGYIPIEQSMVETEQITSTDLIRMSRKISESIALLPPISTADLPPNIAFLEIKNNTNEILDTYNILSKVRKNLIANLGTKVSFLDRERVDAIKRERNAKRTGDVSANDIDQLQGVDYFLTGNATSLTKTDQRLREIYYRFSFRLVNAETSGIIWEDDYEFKKFKRSSWIN